MTRTDEAGVAGEAEVLGLGRVGVLGPVGTGTPGTDVTEAGLDVVPGG